MITDITLNCRLDHDKFCDGVDVNTSPEVHKEARDRCLASRMSSFVAIVESGKFSRKQAAAIVGGLCGNNAVADVLPSVGVLVSHYLSPVVTEQEKVGENNV